MSRTTTTQRPSAAQYACLTAAAVGEKGFGVAVATILACTSRGWLTGSFYDGYTITDAGLAAIERGVRTETPSARRRRASRKVITAITKITAETDLTIDDIADALGVGAAAIAASAASFRNDVIAYSNDDKPLPATTRRLTRNIEFMVICPVSEKVIGLCATDCPSGHRDRSLFMTTREHQMQQLARH